MSDEKKKETRGRPPKEIILQSIPKSSGYCRKCKQVLSLSHFYESPYVFLDTNGCMSICEKCCNGLYDGYFSLYNSVDKALHCVCRDLDLRYSVSAVESTKSHIEKSMAKGQGLNKIFGTYKSKLFSITCKNSGIDLMRYQDSDKPAFGTDNVGTSMNTAEGMVNDVDIVMFWGRGFETEDILFLENELSLWKLQYKCDNQAEAILFKEICIKTLEIRKFRAEGKSTQKSVEDLQKLMSTAGVDPSRAKEIDSDKNRDAYGLWLKDIEENEPAEYFEDKKLFLDFDKISKYINAFIFRPLRNLLLGSRDFNIGEFDIDNKHSDISERDISEEDESTLLDEEFEEGDNNAN